MEESFKEYDEGWYMGAESSQAWAGAVKEEVGSLEYASDFPSKRGCAVQMALERVGSGCLPIHQEPCHRMNMKPCLALVFLPSLAI